MTKTRGRNTSVVSRASCHAYTYIATSTPMITAPLTAQLTAPHSTKRARVSMSLVTRETRTGRRGRGRPEAAAARGHGRSWRGHLFARWSVDVVVVGLRVDVLLVDLLVRPYERGVRGVGLEQVGVGALGGEVAVLDEQHAVGE